MLTSKLDQESQIALLWLQDIQPQPKRLLSDKERGLRGRRSQDEICLRQLYPSRFGKMSPWQRWEIGSDEVSVSFVLRHAQSTTIEFCTHARACMTYMHPCIRANMHGCIHPSIHPSMHPAVPYLALPCIALNCIPFHTIQTYIPAHLPTCLPVCLGKSTYLSTYTHTYTH